MQSCGMGVIKYILFAFNFIFAVSKQEKKEEKILEILFTIILQCGDTFYTFEKFPFRQIRKFQSFHFFLLVFHFTLKRLLQISILLFLFKNQNCMRWRRFQIYCTVFKKKQRSIAFQTN